MKRTLSNEKGYERPLVLICTGEASDEIICTSPLTETEDFDNVTDINW